MADYMYTATSSSLDVKYNVTPLLGSYLFDGEASIQINGVISCKVSHSTYTISLRSAASSTATVYDSRTGGYLDTQTGQPKEFAAGKTPFSFSVTLSVSKTGTGRNNSVYIGFQVTNSHNAQYWAYSTTSFSFAPGHFVPAFNTDFTIERCTTAGAVSSDGTKLLVKNLKLTWNKSCGISSYSGISVRYARLYNTSGYQVGSTVSLTSGQVQSMSTTSGYSETSPSLLSGLTVDKTQAYRLEFEFGDQYETAKLSVDLPLPQTIVDFGLDGGFAVGQYSTSTASDKKFEVAKDHSSYFYGPACLTGGADIPGVNSYQSGEQLTGGTWINGKPIYRFAWTGSYDLQSPSRISIGSAYDMVVSFFGMMTGSPVGMRMLPFAHNAGAGYTVTPTFHYAEGQFSLTSGSNAASQYKTVTLTFILEYTKGTLAADPGLPEPEYESRQGVT